MSPFSYKDPLQVYSYAPRVVVKQSVGESLSSDQDYSDCPEIDTRLDMAKSILVGL